MRKCICIVLSVLLMMGLAACGNNAASSTTTESVVSTKQPTEQPNEAESVSEISAEPVSEPESAPAESSAEESVPEEPQSGSNILVVYFSCIGEQYGVGVIDKGNTEIVAEMVAESTGADLYEIVPSEAYPLVYNELTDIAQEELRENARPEIAGKLPDLSGYDTIFIGAPVWWGDWPMICYTFFESVDLSGKTLYPFSTHAGSGLSGFDTKLQNAVPGSTVGMGLAIRGADCQNDPDSVRQAVVNWLDGLGFSE